jgi:hypothetical protein
MIKMWSRGVFESVSGLAPPLGFCKRHSLHNPQERQVKVTSGSLTRGQINAVRAAAKAGITHQ